MAAGFDPYHRWLSIPPSEQPPNHYRLLGLQAFESSIEVIENAAARQAAHVRQQLQSPLRPYAVNLLREIEVARLCLRDVETRSGYDAWLRTRSPSGAASIAMPSPVAAFSSTVETEAADNAWPPIGPTSPQAAFNAAIATSSRGRARRRRSPVAFLLLWLAGGMMGLLSGYAVLCMVGPQYDFLNLVFDRPRGEVDSAVANNESAPMPAALATAAPQRFRREPSQISRPALPRSVPTGASVTATTASSMSGPQSTLPDIFEEVEPPKVVMDDTDVPAGLKPVVVPFDLKKRVLRVIAPVTEPLSPHIVCDIEGSRELRFKPIEKLPLGERSEMIFQAIGRDMTIGAEVSFLRRNDVVVVEIRPKYKLPSGDEEALYRSAGLRKIKVLSNQVATASNAKQALPGMRQTLSRVSDAHREMVTRGNTPGTGRSYLGQLAAQNHAGTLAAQGAQLEQQIRESESIAARLPHLEADLEAVRLLGDWSGEVAKTATISVSIHAEGVGILAEAR